VKEKIEEFIKSLEKDNKLFKYLCNKSDKEFVPEKDTIFYAGPYWDYNEKIAIIKAILDGDWLSSGNYVRQFENEFSKMFNFKYSSMVNSGSSANLITINALKLYYNWKDGDEIILSPSGFPTTLTPIIQNNLKPIFVDISWNDLNFNVKKVEQVITDKTKAVFISPVLGNPMNMNYLAYISKNHKIPIILDNCDSLGSKWDGKYLSDYCIVSSCSFYPSHHITTGEGGMISTNIKEIYKIAKSLSSWGRACVCVGTEGLLKNGACGKRFSKWLDGYNGIIDHKYVFSNIGYNLKPLDLQGAVGLEQLKKFDKILALRKSNNLILSQIFSKIEGVRTLKELPLADTSWFGTGIICDTQKLKEELMQYLEDNRIQTRNYFAGNLLMHPAFKDFGDIKNYPIANDVIRKVFFIGCSPVITKRMISYIKDIVYKFKEL